MPTILIHTSPASVITRATHFDSKTGLIDGKFKTDGRVGKDPQRSGYLDVHRADSITVEYLFDCGKIGLTPSKPRFQIEALDAKGVEAKSVAVNPGGTIGFAVASKNSGTIWSGKNPGWARIRVVVEELAATAPEGTLKIRITLEQDDPAAVIK